MDTNYENNDYGDLLFDGRSYELKNLWVKYFYTNEGDGLVGSPVATSIEIFNVRDNVSRDLKWYKKVSHTYLSLDNSSLEQTDIYEEELENALELIKKLEDIDLPSLGNNYFTDKVPEKYSRWEIGYNYYFKIVGTDDQMIDEYKNICKLLDFQNIIKNELDKVKSKLKED